MFNESLRGTPLFHEVTLLDSVFVQELSTNTLSQFLIENEGKRCVVVLDVRSQHFTVPDPKKFDSSMNLQEIEKVEDPKVLYSLLMPWELGKGVARQNTPFLTHAGSGRCSLLAGHRQVDVRQVIWLGTSNIAHDLVFEYCGSLPGKNITREEYLELAQQLRPGISHSLGVRNTTSG